MKWKINLNNKKRKNYFMDIFKRLINFISVASIIFCIFIIPLSIYDHQTRIVYRLQSHENNLIIAEKNNLYDEYMRAYSMWEEFQKKKIITDEIKKLNQGPFDVFMFQDQWDRFIYSTDVFNENIKMTYKDISENFFQIENQLSSMHKKELNNKKTLEFLKNNYKIPAITLSIIIFLNYIFFGFVGLFHKVKK